MIKTNNKKGQTEISTLIKIAIAVVVAIAVLLLIYNFDIVTKLSNLIPGFGGKA